MFVTLQNFVIFIRVIFLITVFDHFLMKRQAFLQQKAELSSCHRVCKASCFSCFVDFVDKCNSGNKIKDLSTAGLQSLSFGALRKWMMNTAGGQTLCRMKTVLMVLQNPMKTTNVRFYATHVLISRWKQLAELICCQF